MGEKINKDGNRRFFLYALPKPGNFLHRTLFPKHLSLPLITLFVKH